MSSPSPSRRGAHRRSRSPRTRPVTTRSARSSTSASSSTPPRVRRRSSRSVHSESSSFPIRTRSQSRRAATSSRRREEDDNAVYLLQQRATGTAAASNFHNQVTFMELMGLVDSDTVISETLERTTPFPVDDEEVRILETALSHRFYEEYRKRGICDGHFTDDQRVRCTLGTLTPCQCISHQCLRSTLQSENYKDDLKALIRSPDYISSSDEGVGMMLALLRRLVHLFNMPYIKVSEGGRSNGVSYILLHKEKKYSFRGFPDFVAHVDDVDAERILISTGEIQSTGDPDTQNSIYGVGSLLKRDEDDNRPIVCITLFKRKYATLSVARLERVEGQPGDVVGKVSLKYVVSPSPIDLIHDLHIFAKRLYYLLKYNTRD